jgi:hypothetical protein
VETCARAACAPDNSATMNSQRRIAIASCAAI